MTPRFRPGVRLHHDALRDRWVVMAPERMFVPDEIALAVLQLVDGTRTRDAIIDTLAASFTAPRAEIAADVAELLDDLATRGVLEA
jgi:pyrroloquinoline quinone biosynthesis protein D